MDIIKSIEHEQLKNKVQELKVGNTVRVHVKIKEGNKERIQVFEGIIIKKQGGGVNETFTVRKISYGVGVEKTFLVHSPLVEKVEVVRVGKVRRAKLYYLKERMGKASKPKEKVGARIETNEITVKEDLADEEVAPETIESEAETVAAAEEVPVAEETNETPKKEPVAEENTKSTVEEAKIEEVAEAPEEAPAVETTETVKEEVVDTVTEEAVEEVKEAPEEAEEAKEEVAEETAPAEEPIKEETPTGTEEATAEEDKKEE